MKTLPDKASELIRLAIDDLEKTEKDDRYKINMTRWHVPDYEDYKVCSVCLAGAVMAQSLDANPYEWVSPSVYQIDVALKLKALNYLRYMVGYCLEDGLALLDQTMPENLVLPDNPVEYEKDPGLFKQQMRDLASELERCGL